MGIYIHISEISNKLGKGYFMKNVQWIFVLYSILAVSFMVGIGISISYQNLALILTFVFALIIVMGFGFKTKKKMREMEKI